MRRSGFLALTGLTPGKYNIIIARDQLPFADPQAAERFLGDAAGLKDSSRWAEYSPLHAVQWHLTDTLASTVAGLTITRAASIVRNCGGEIADNLSRTEAATKGAGERVFAGILHYRTPPHRGMSAGHKVGTLKEINTLIQEAATRGDNCVRIFLADIGDAVIEVRRRAAIAGIDLPESADDWSRTDTAGDR